MDILNKKQKIIIMIIAIFMVLFIGFYIVRKTNSSQYVELETEENEIIENIIKKEEILEDEKQNVIIHVVGEVKKQGIVQVKENSRISDVIEAAGGATSEADLSKINLAYAVKDGQKIYVPNINDETDIEIVIENAGENVLEDNNEKSSKVNINTATQTELETLNGVGPSTALKIINYRKENGNFERIEDIKNVPGIGDAKFESLKESICIK